MGTLKCSATQLYTDRCSSLAPPTIRIILSTKATKLRQNTTKNTAKKGVSPYNIHSLALEASKAFKALPRWRNWLARLTVNQEVDGSSPSRGAELLFAQGWALKRGD